MNISVKKEVPKISTVHAAFVDAAQAGQRKADDQGPKLVSGEEVGAEGDNAIINQASRTGEK